MNLDDNKLSNSFLFEASYEVCNKVGGIYTVIKTKAPHIKKYFQENYFLIGPYVPQNQGQEFVETGYPQEFLGILKDLSLRGIIVHYGKWLISSYEMKVFLIDYTKFWHNINQYKTLLWKEFLVDSLNAPNDYDEPFIFGIAVGILFEQFAAIHKDRQLFFHFHEWLMGSALLYLKLLQKENNNFKLIFTTHATILGRTITNSGVALYEKINEVSPDKEAKRFNIFNKFSLERAAIVNADKFSTVSEITSYEAEKFYHRKADVICHNGIDIKNLPTFEEISIIHHIKREALRELLLYLFFPYYKFEVENTLFYFTSGRPEFKDKGYDIFIKALGKLNQELKKDVSFKSTIISFFLVPFENIGPKSELFIYKERFAEIRRLITENNIDLMARLIYLTMENKKCDLNFLFSEKVFSELKNKIKFFKEESGFPPLSTHIFKEENNEYMKYFKENGLLNSKDDKIKVIFIPIYLTGQDGLVNLNYQDFIQGCHLGVFASYYEPFGYTPLETAALGVASITTDLSGYGQFIRPFLKNKKNPGVFVLERFGKKDEETIDSLASLLKRYTYFSTRERVENKISAIQLSAHSDWSQLISNYIDLYNY